MQVLLDKTLIWVKNLHGGADNAGYDENWGFIRHSSWINLLYHLKTRLTAV
jgi:hypothetical protein